MAFKIKSLEKFIYKTPQEMYQDNKLKKIMGPLDYQSAMLDLYMENIEKSTIALELPTGSGKTLIGLLIGEYRRRKNKEKVLFLCPTNQLVNQVARQANEKYGLNAIAFCGKQSHYDSKDKSEYLLANAIGVTTYSSFFAENSFFNDADILIMDDVHSCEEYIISNWTINLVKQDSAFMQVAELMKNVISEFNYENLMCEYSEQVKNWCDLVPMPLFSDKLNDLASILRTSIEEGTSNWYAFKRIGENLQECNIYLSNGHILIRPWIAPTLTFKAFYEAKQRVLMSATLGESGELERITGIKNIFKLPIVNNWDKKGLGRKFFIFPDLSFTEENHGEILKCLHNIMKKSVILVPHLFYQERLKKFINEQIIEADIFDANSLESTRENFNNSNNAIAILANRFDGIDFADDECRLLFIMDLPTTTNIQENFLINKMGASKLYEERIKTRIIQAVGRCSRNASDYSVVCVLGSTILNNFTKENKLREFYPELRAELSFGIENSAEYSEISDIIEQVNDFINRTSEWKEAEQYIVNLRNRFWDEKNEARNEIILKLENVANLEVDFQYSLWQKKYKEAFDISIEIIEKLNAPSLGGYKSFWQYVAGVLAFNIFSSTTSEEYKNKAISLFEACLKNRIGIRWLPEMVQKVFKSENYSVTSESLEEVIINLEENFMKMKTKTNLDKNISKILDNLRSCNGKVFENGHLELGRILGYVSEKSIEEGAPDPYWIFNSEKVVVAEDKIYDETNIGKSEKKIPLVDVSEALRHEEWIKSKYPNVKEIIPIFITNSDTIDDSAKIHAKSLYYVSRNEFIAWAIKATNIIREIWNTFCEPGNMEWRNSVYKRLVDEKITPLNFIEFSKKQKLSDI